MRTRWFPEPLPRWTGKLSLFLVLRATDPLGRDIESSLRALLSDMAWDVVREYSCQSSCETPFGEVAFEDAVQTWVNPWIVDRTEERSV